MTESHINIFFLSSFSLSITTLFLIVLISKHIKEKIQLIWILFNLSIFLWAFGATWASTISSNPQLARIAWKIGCGLGASFSPVFLLHLTYLLTKKRINKILPLSYVLVIVISALMITTNTFFDIQSTKYNNFFIKAPTTLYVIWFIIWSSLIIYAHFLLFKFFVKKQSAPQLKLFIIATFFAFSAGGFNFLSAFRIPLFEYGNFGLSIYCILATYIIFRHEFIGIKIIIKKSIFYSMLIATMTGLYLMLIFIIEFLFRGFIGYKSIILSLSSAFVIAVIFNPLRNKLQALIDRLFLGKTPQEIARENELLMQELERSERLKVARTLSLGLAHEIKNPLTTIKTFSEYLPEKYLDEDFVKKFASIVPSEVDRINNIIHRILDFSKPSSPSLKKTDISGLIDDTLQFLDSEFLKHKIEVIKEYIDADISLLIDPSQIKQVLINLLLNAIDAMPNGGKLTIKTYTEKNIFAVIEISDTGCGITANNLKNIFNPFFSTKDSGSGLGLSISDQIIKNHNGRIEVESKIKEGTKFKITLPIIK